MKAAPFHRGELLAQQLAGQIAAGHGIREHMPDQHRLFFEALPFVLLASAGDDGAPAARVLHGAPGFIRSPDALTLELDCVTGLRAGAAVGLLGIDFATRRRNRANGVVRSNEQGKLVVGVDESFGNCPKYITPRQVEAAPAGIAPAHGVDRLAPEAREIVAAADTFFIATSGAGHGLDISHRGGAAGFVRIDGNTLSVPDFSGNRYFNTLGNLLLEPRAALLFIDFATGDVLTLDGQASIAFPQRDWRFEVARGSLQRGAVPLRWRLL